MNRNLSLLSASMCAWGLGEGLFFIFQPIYLQQWGASPLLIGSIMGINGIMMIFSQIPAGYIADRIGARPLMRALWTASTLAVWVMALANSLTVFTIGLFLYGFAAYNMVPVYSYITQVRGKMTAERAITFVSSFYHLGAILGPFLGGIIGSRYGLKWVYFIAGFIVILSTLLVFFVEKQPIIHHSDAPRQPLWQNKKFMGFLVLILFTSFTAYFAEPFSPNFLQNQRQLNLTQIGELGSIAGIGNVLIAFLVGYLHAVPGILIGQGLVLSFCSLMLAGNNFYWFGFAYLLSGGFRLCRSMYIAFSNSLVEASKMSLSYGLIETVNAIAIIIAPPIAGLLYNWNPNSIYYFGLFGTLLVLGMNVFFLPHLRRHSVSLHPGR